MSRYVFSSPSGIYATYLRVIEEILDKNPPTARGSYGANYKLLESAKNRVDFLLIARKTANAPEIQDVRMLAKGESQGLDQLRFQPDKWHFRDCERGAI